MENRFAGALREAESRPGFVNLIDTNYHSCGLEPDAATLAEAFAAYLAHPDVRRYRPDSAGLPALREAIARWYTDAGVMADPASIIVTASASESYRHLFTAVCGSGATVLLPQPGYPLFEDVALRCGLEPRFYRLHSRDGWAVDPERIATLIDPRTRAVVLISPNNPTGTVLDADAAVSIGALCRGRNLALIVDEVFSEYLFDETATAGTRGVVARGTGRQDAARLRAGALPRPAALCPGVPVFTINGVSKLFASPDLKVSWILLTGPTVRVSRARERLQVENDLYLSASPLNQFAASRLFESGLGRAAAIAEEVARRRRTMLEALEQLDARHPRVISWRAPQGAIHLPIVFTRPPGGLDDEEIAIALLHEQGVSVHPGYLYGAEDETMIVTSYLARPEVIREGIARIEAFVSSRDRMRAARR